MIAHAIRFNRNIMGCKETRKILKEVKRLRFNRNIMGCKERYSLDILGNNTCDLIGT